MTVLDIPPSLCAPPYYHNLPTIATHPCPRVWPGAGTGGLGLAIEGPSEAKMSCVDNRDGSCTVEYVPTEPGDYDVNVRYADQHIPGSPFKVGSAHDRFDRWNWVAVAV